MHIFFARGGKIFSGTKKEPKPKLFGPDIFQWGRGLPRERVGAKKFDTSLETREIKLIGRDITRDFAGISRPISPKSLREKKVWVRFSFPIFFCSGRGNGVQGAGGRWVRFFN